MAAGNVEYFSRTARLAFGSQPQISGASLGSESVTFTTATQSSAFPDHTHYIRIVATAACYYVIGANPTADTDSTFLPAGAIEYRPAEAGQKISFYDGTS